MPLMCYLCGPDDSYAISSPAGVRIAIGGRRAFVVLRLPLGTFAALPRRIDGNVAAEVVFTRGKTRALNTAVLFRSPGGEWMIQRDAENPLPLAGLRWGFWRWR